MAAIVGSGALVNKKPLLAATTYVPDPRIWDTDDKQWGGADAVYSEARPVMIRGNEFFQVDNGPNFGGEQIFVALGRTGLTIFGRDRGGQWKADPNRIKQITCIYPLFRGVFGTVINVSIGSQENIKDPIIWEGPREFIIGQDSFLDFIVAGRYLAVRFTSVDQPSWELFSYDLDLELVGGR